MKKGFSSICIDDHINGFLPENIHTPPIYAGSTFVYPSIEKAIKVFKGEDKSYIYSRWNNPGVALIESKIALLEAYTTENIINDYSALAFSSGMAAIQSLLNSLYLKSGDSIIAQGNIYGTTVELMDTIYKNAGINIIYEDFDNADKVLNLISKTKNLKVVYLESPANPTLSCYDIKKYSKAAADAGAFSIVDNTFSTPYFQRPLQSGADFVIHSTTKFLNGHGTALGGFVISKHKQHIEDKLYTIRKVTGSIMSATDAWHLNNGLKTLEIRMEKHQQNSLILAKFLLENKFIDKVHYPGIETNKYHQLAKEQMFGFGGMMSFNLKGNMETAVRFMKAIKFCKITASLGTPDTLIQHPASMTHIKVPKEQRLAYGINDTLIRISVGMEDIKNIKEDILNALHVANNEKI
ncbi:MAG: PLP-dependent transferase [Chitinophagaceae bacterium]|nr:MAG: PLP-dependent transferase [Chitinophagaceae bacterium]